jgi:hypothetical protein
MSNPRDDGNILHETDTEASVREDLERSGQVGYTNEEIADPASPGASYVQAEVVALRTAIVAILEVLRANGLVAEAEA